MNCKIPNNERLVSKRTRGMTAIVSGQVDSEASLYTGVLHGAVLQNNRSAGSS